MERPRRRLKPGQGRHFAVDEVVRIIVQEVWKEISSQTEQGADRTLVFVVHGGTIMAVMEAFSEEKKSYYDWQVGNGEGVLGKMDASDGQIRNARIMKAK